MRDSPILGLFAREGYERPDTSRQCCDGRCNDNQGRGGCPRVPESMPKACQRARTTYRRWPFFAMVAAAVVCGVLPMVMR